MITNQQKGGGMKLYRVNAYTANLNPVEYYITSVTCTSDDLLDHFSKNKFTGIKITQLSFENLEKLENGEFGEEYVTVGAEAHWRRFNQENGTKPGEKQGK